MSGALSRGTRSGARLWIGPSGWSYPDWHGVFYPVPPPRNFRPLKLVATLFNCVEINTSFYRTPSPRVSSAWAAQTPADFRFAVKLLRDYTHRRDQFPEPSAAREIQAALAPLREAGKLGPMLMQFPWSFRFEPASREWLDRLADAFGDYERFVEVRHVSWLSDEGLAALAACGGFCNIDQPALRECIPLTQYAFGSSAYLRLHGRNKRMWFAKNAPPFERYNFFYESDELSGLAESVESMLHCAQDVYVFANNHYRAQGVANALELMALLGLRLRDLPEELLQTYPRLRDLSSGPRQGELFAP